MSHGTHLKFKKKSIVRIQLYVLNPKPMQNLHSNFARRSVVEGKVSQRWRGAIGNQEEAYVCESIDSSNPVGAGHQKFL
jgi:hypothetical protein